jgi:FkbM family methyltransferase
VCLRRTFEREIAAGRVVLVEKGVWETEGTLTFRTQSTNTAAGRVILNASSRQPGDTMIPVTTIDQIVQDNGLSRVDQIKMDIEGSERYALAGAKNTLVRYRPRLSIAAYHLPDDTEKLPAVILGTVPSYSTQCTQCGPDTNGRVVPEVILFQ